jgi:glycosyltransferase involved in cell wall biosynthesis
MSPSVTIIIPTYNRAEELKRLLDQISLQTTPPEQIIVVDDRSTDETKLLLSKIVQENPSVHYLTNSGRYQRDAKKTGLSQATGDFIGFLDDDAVIENRQFFSTLRSLLQEDRVIQAKVILEQMGKRDLPNITMKDRLAVRPYPILELITTNLNRGSKPRTIFPLIDWGNFWHRSLASYLIDNNLVKDAYGESYSASIKLRQADIKLVIQPELVIRHPGAKGGGSHRFNKKAMTLDFTEFHYGYFYNMISIHARFFPDWIWLWLPYFFLKSLIALALNRNATGWHRYALRPIGASLVEHQAIRGVRLAGHAQKPSIGQVTDPKGGPKESQRYKIFVWQGNWRGGAEQVTLAAAKHLSDHGFDVTLGVYHSNPRLPLKQIVYPQVRWVPQSFQALIASLIFRQRHAADFSAVYAHTLGAWKTRSSKLFIHEAADLDRKLKETAGFTRKGAYLLWRQLYLSLCLARAEVIFAATPECAAYLQRKRIKPVRIKLSHSFYDEKNFHFVSRPRPTSQINLIFVGNHQDPVKNFAAARRLLSHSSSCRITVAGGPPRAAEKNITYRGYLSRQELQRELARADIFFMPSRSEGFSLALLEALATGMPCLVNQVVIPSSLKNARNLISYNTEDEMLPQIGKIIANYATYSAPDPLLSFFAQSIVLDREASAIHTRLATDRRIPLSR